MLISIASGKGGTGKTTIAVSLAMSIDENAQLLDCDVEEPNIHIFLQPHITKSETFFTKIPQINLERCDFCGKCSSVCAFNAIAVIPGVVNIFPELCHSCGACKYFCPLNAIDEIKQPVGVIEYGESNGVNYVCGRLNVGQAMPTSLIKAVKKQINHVRYAIIDAPPGTSCAMVQSVLGSQYCILVTEPTPFGLNDLKLAVDVLMKLKIPFGVIINRCDMGDNKVEKYCYDMDIKILMKIPFDRKIAENYALGKSLIGVFPKYKEEFKKIFIMIKNNNG